MFQKHTLIHAHTTHTAHSFTWRYRQEAAQDTIVWIYIHKVPIYTHVGLCTLHSGISFNQLFNHKSASEFMFPGKVSARGKEKERKLHIYLYVNITSCHVRHFSWIFFFIFFKKRNEKAPCIPKWLHLSLSTCSRVRSVKSLRVQPAFWEDTWERVKKLRSTLWGRRHKEKVCWFWMMHVRWFLCLLVLRWYILMLKDVFFSSFFIWLKAPELS